MQAADRPLRLRALILSATLIATPIICGFSYLNLFAPPQTPGLYAMTSHGMFRIADFYDLQQSADPATVLRSGFRSTTMLPDERDGIVCFFIVRPRTAARTTPTVRLYFAVAERGSATVLSALMPLPVDVRPVNAGLFRVTSAQTARWDLLRPEFAAVLTRTPGSRATKDGLLVVVVDDEGEPTSRLFPIRIGPPERLDPADPM